MAPIRRRRLRPRGATGHDPLANLAPQDRARTRAGHCRNESARFMLDESHHSDEHAKPTRRSTHHAQRASAPETRSSSRRNRCRCDADREIPIARLILKRPSVGPRLPSLEVCGRRPTWRHRRPGGAGSRWSTSRPRDSAPCRGCLEADGPAWAFPPERKSPLNGRSRSGLLIGAGFEPARRLHACLVISQVHSATLPPCHVNGGTQEVGTPRANRKGDGLAFSCSSRGRLRFSPRGP